MKLRSTRLNIIMDKNNVIINMIKLYPNPIQSKEPLPIQLYLKVSNIGVSGLSDMNIRYFSGAALNG